MAEIGRDTVLYSGKPRYWIGVVSESQVRQGGVAASPNGN